MPGWLHAGAFRESSITWPTLTACLVLCGRRVSAGLLGVLVEVTLAVVPDYPVYRDLQVIRSVSHGFCHLGLDSPVSLHSWTRELP